MRRLTELLVLAVLSLRAWLEGQVERRHPLITLECGRWSVTVRADSGNVVQRLVDAWNADTERRWVCPARVIDGGIVLTAAEGERWLCNTTGRDASWADIAASLAARAALFILPGGRPTRAAR